MLRSLDLGEIPSLNSRYAKSAQKGHFFAKNDVFLTKKRAKNAVFCYWSVNLNKIYVVDSMCVISNFIGKNALLQPRGGGYAAISPKQPQRTEPIRLQDSRQANKDLQVEQNQGLCSLIRTAVGRRSPLVAST
jgi:hypothetical protein